MTALGKRNRILSATAELLMEQGLLAVQTRMVTERAGVGTGLLNHYFRWPDLRAQAWAAIFEAVAADLRRGGESPAEALERFMSESFLPEARPFWRLWIEAESLAVKDAQLAEALSAARMRLRQGLADILSGGSADATWQLSDPRATALRLEALRDGLAGLLLAGDPELDPDSACEHLRSAFRREVESSAAT